MFLQARASAQQGTLVARELHKNAYNEALVARYSHLPAIRRIQRNRHLPAPLYKARTQRLMCHCVLAPVMTLLTSSIGSAGPDSKTVCEGQAPVAMC